MKYDVPLIPQRTNMGCWAASIAMILSWKNDASFDPGSIAANSGGPSYVPELTNGLDPNDRHILERNGFKILYPQCYTYQGFIDLLDAYGPLWVAGAVPSPHIRVVTGYYWGLLSVNDPWPPNRGEKYLRAFSTFMLEMETLGADELGEPAPVYVAHMA